MVKICTKILIISFIYQKVWVFVIEIDSHGCKKNKRNKLMGKSRFTALLDIERIQIAFL